MTQPEGALPSARCHWAATAKSFSPLHCKVALISLSLFLSFVPAMSGSVAESESSPNSQATDHRPKLSNVNKVRAVLRSLANLVANEGPISGPNCSSCKDAELPRDREPFAVLSPKTSKLVFKAVDSAESTAVGNGSAKASQEEGLSKSSSPTSDQCESLQLCLLSGYCACVRESNRTSPHKNSTSVP